MAAERYEDGLYNSLWRLSLPVRGGVIASELPFLCWALSNPLMGLVHSVKEKEKQGAEKSLPMKGPSNDPPLPCRKDKR